MAGTRGYHFRPRRQPRRFEAGHGRRRSSGQGLGSQGAETSRDVGGSFRLRIRRGLSQGQEPAGQRERGQGNQGLGFEDQGAAVFLIGS